MAKNFQNKKESLKYLKKGTKITDVKIFATKKEMEKNIYHDLNEVLDIEEIEEMNEEILLNLEKIKLKQIKNKEKSKIIVANINNPTVLKANIFNEIGKIKNPNQQICKLISNKVKIKLLFRIEMRLIPSKKLNQKRKICV